MRRLFFFLAFLSVFSAGISQEPALKEVRQLFLEAGTDSCRARELFGMLEDRNLENAPVLLAYKGVAEAMLAQCTRRNLEKLNVFLAGKKNLEQALSLAPDDWEIRFLRFQLQTQIPSILGYNDFKTDKPILLQVLPAAVRTEPDSLYLAKVIRILILSGEFSLQEEQELKGLLNKLSSAQGGDNQ